MPVIVNETVNGEASLISLPLLDEPTANCSKNGSQEEEKQVIDKDKVDNNLPPPSLQGYKQLRSNEGSSESESSDSPGSSPNSSLLESVVDESCAAASTLVVNSSVVPPTSADNNNVDSDDDEESDDGSGNISSLESSLSNYTDCTSNFSSEDDSEEFKSPNATADEEVRPLLLAEVDDRGQGRKSSSSSESSDTSHVSATSCSSGNEDVFSITTTSSSSSSCLSAVSMRGLNKTVSFSSNLPAIPNDVERENRKNVIKTLQGQAEIISNWSLVKRSEDGRKMWMLMGGTPYDFANKIHNNFRPPSAGGSSVALNLTKDAVVILDSPPKLIGKKDNVDLQNKSKSPTTASTSALVTETVSMSSALSSTMASLVNISDDEENCTNSDAVVEPEDEKPREYKGTRLYPCGKCNGVMYLVSKLYWYKHVIKEHGREERAQNRDVLYTCRFCPKQFGRQKSRNAHEKSHGASQSV